MTSKLTAKLVSFVFNPLFVFIGAAYVLATWRTFDDVIAFVIFVVVGWLLPLSVIMYRFVAHKHDPLDIPARSRTDIYLAGVAGFSFLGVLFGTQAYPAVFWQNLSIATAMYFGVFLLVNRYFDKASQHVGMIAFWAMLPADKVNMAYALLLLVLPVVMWARILLHKHTWPQILWGLTIGMFVGLLSWGF